MPALKNNARAIAYNAVTASAYAALTIFSSFLQLAYGPVQIRLSEALCVLPFLFPSTAWGLWVGCLLGNLLSPYGLADIVVGSLATLLAASLTARCRSRFAAIVPPIVCNAVPVGAMIAWEQVGTTAAFFPTMLYHMSTIALGEALVCALLGLPLLRLLERYAAGKGKNREKKT